jgi:hypothetical protein
MALSHSSSVPDWMSLKMLKRLRPSKCVRLGFIIKFYHAISVRNLKYVSILSYSSAAVRNLIEKSTNCLLFQKRYATYV